MIYIAPYLKAITPCFKPYQTCYKILQVKNSAISTSTIDLVFKSHRCLLQIAAYGVVKKRIEHKGGQR